MKFVHFYTFDNFAFSLMLSIWSHPRTWMTFFIKWTISGKPPVGLKSHQGSKWGHSNVIHYVAHWLWPCMSVCLSVPLVEIVPSYSIQNVLECPRMFQNVLECSRCSRMFQKVPEISRKFQKVPECMQNVQECIQNVPECIQNVPECSRMHAECSRMFQNACRMFQNACRTFQNLCKMSQNACRMFQNVPNACRSMSLHAIT